MLVRAPQPRRMGQTAILFPQGLKQDGAQAWLARAAQARRLALMLAPGDAAILEVFARECEAKAALVPTTRPIAA
ncbi:MAG TPA: hypothetical protein VHK44_06120 [Xanthobacteraceae bacterium]|nr:hypothetical protein [Xanthobacteraceae bacterium]